MSGSKLNDFCVCVCVIRCHPVQTGKFTQKSGVASYENHKVKWPRAHTAPVTSPGADGRAPLCIDPAPRSASPQTEGCLPLVLGRALLASRWQVSEEREPFLVSWPL